MAPHPHYWCQCLSKHSTCPVSWFWNRAAYSYHLKSGWCNHIQSASTVRASMPHRSGPQKQQTSLPQTMPPATIGCFKLEEICASDDPHVSEFHPDSNLLNKRKFKRFLLVRRYRVIWYCSFNLGCTRSGFNLWQVKDLRYGCCGSSTFNSFLVSCSRTSSDYFR